MSRTARPRARSAPPRQPLVRDGAHASATPIASPPEHVGLLNTEHLHALKSFEHYSQQLPESGRRLSKAYRELVSALLQTSELLCQCASAVPPAPSAACAAERGGLARSALSLARSHKALLPSTLLTVLDTELSRLATGAGQLCTASKSVRSSHKAMQSAVRKVQKTGAQQPSPQSASSSTTQRRLAALSAAQENARASRWTLESLLSTTLQPMLSGYKNVITTVVQQLADTFTSRSTSSTRQAATQTEAPPSVPSPPPAPLPTPSLPLAVAASPVATAAAARRQAETQRTADPTSESPPILQQVSRAFESLFERFVAGVSPAVTTTARAAADAPAPARRPVHPAVPAAVVRGTVVRVLGPDPAAGAWAEGNEDVEVRPRASSTWRAEGLPPPQYPDYLFSSGDLITAAQRPGTHQRSERPR